MKILYVPVFRAAIGYVVSLGRRWSLLEQLLLIELAHGRRSVSQLSADADVPERIVVEALINLLRVGWIEVRSTEGAALYTATTVGRIRANEQELQPELRRDVKWASLCMDRLTGSWMRSNDLDLVYNSDLPEDANLVEPVLSTLNYDDPGVRDLIHLKSNEGFEGFQPNTRAPSRPYAKIVVAYNELQKGLPHYVPPKFREAILTAAEEVPETKYTSESPANVPLVSLGDCYDDLTTEDIIVGGADHLALLKDALAEVRSHIIIHSCFLQPSTIAELLPDLEKAANRKVRIDLLWGLNWDPESLEKPSSVSEVEQVLGRVKHGAKGRIMLSPLSSGSHSKVVLYDRGPDGAWTTIVGSCNFLSSAFNLIEISVRSRSQRLASQLLGYLIAGQLPASGAWSATARRLNFSWNRVRQIALAHPEKGSHNITLLADEDHYSCVTMARDQAKQDIFVGCDLFGLAAETSVLVPLERAAQLGKKVSVFFQRPSKHLQESGTGPDSAEIAKRGIAIANVKGLHGKVLGWDQDTLAITSFNWLSTAVVNARPRGAELGVLIRGSEARKLLAVKLSTNSHAAINLI